MRKQLLSRRTFLKGSAVAIVSVALAGCREQEPSSSSVSVSGYMYGVGYSQVEIYGPYFHQELPDIVEFRLKITNDGSTLTLNPSCISLNFDNQPAVLSEKRLSNSTRPYLLDCMPLSTNQSAVGYLLMQAKKNTTHYQIKLALTHDTGATDNYTFDFDFSKNNGSHSEWYE